ncbi:MAG: JAB domain-containing protein, partial [Phenylobacterium sp.]
MPSPVSLAEPSPRALAAARAEAQSRRRHLEARLLAPGPITLDDASCLELLCGLDESAALALIEAFGSLPEVLGAPAADLARTVGGQAAGRVKLAQELSRRQLERPLRVRAVLSSSAAVDAYLRATLVGAPREQFRVLFLDKQNRLISDEALWEGTVDHAPVYPREVVRRALELHASAMLLCHNHPGGDPTPSTADIAMTRQVVEAAKALGLGVHDHIVVGGQQTAS